MKEEIETMLVDYVSNASPDKYDQLGVLDFCQVFKNKWEQVKEYNDKYRILAVATYGYRYGTYLGIGSIHSDILDEEIKSKVIKAWANNEIRKNRKKSHRIYID